MSSMSIMRKQLFAVLVLLATLTILVLVECERCCIKQNSNFCLRLGGFNFHQIVTLYACDYDCDLMASGNQPKENLDYVGYSDFFLCFIIFCFWRATTLTLICVFKPSTLLFSLYQLR